ncbi:MmcQ/YjbR family DNA-binding protein, partial [Streptomyces nigra]
RREQGHALVVARRGHVHAGDRRQPVPGGLGRSGWVRVPLEPAGAPAAGLLCEWVEESYRVIAPKRLAAELDAR